MTHCFKRLSNCPCLDHLCILFRHCQGKRPYLFKPAEDPDTVNLFFSFSSFTPLIPSPRRRRKLIRGQQSTLAYVDTHRDRALPHLADTHTHTHRLSCLKQHTTMKHSVPFSIPSVMHQHIFLPAMHMPFSSNREDMNKSQ